MEYKNKIFRNAFYWYTDTIKEYVNESYDGELFTFLRPRQLRDISDLLSKHFKFDTIKCIETGASCDAGADGAVGLYFAKLCELTNGEFYSVDINKPSLDLSKKLYKKHNLEVNHNLKDSVEYLENIDFIPNLVHLDAMDFNLKNPLPSALHGWREFAALKDKMPIGSIIIVDDNWIDGTWIEWVYPEATGLDNEIIDITYPILGKGSLISHFINDEETSSKSGWEMIGVYTPGHNNKLIMKKIK